MNQRNKSIFLIRNLGSNKTIKKISCLLIIALISMVSKSQTPNPALTTLFKDAYHIWELQRNDIGMYRDSKLFNGSDFHPASIANVGTGLVSLCIADAMGWEPNAAQLVLITLKSVNGHTPGFIPDRNASGYYRHFIDMNTGARAWDSEYSTIDTDLLALGAMFCKNYFSNNSEIVTQVDELWNSIDFTKAIANPYTGKIYLSMQANGEGGAGLTSVYNEYMLVAWCAINDKNNSTADAKLLWDNFYKDTSNLPKSTYAGNSVLTDSNSGGFISSFTQLFNYYLCNYFSNSPDYMTYLLNAYNADKQWWIDNLSPTYSWGHGAGVSIGGYNADKINNNPDKIVSPHIIAGFLPINNAGKNDLLDQLNNQKGVYSLPDDPTKKILWRYSLADTSWEGNSVQGIDYSTFLFGLASLPEYLGTNFFSTYNIINTSKICEGVDSDLSILSDFECQENFIYPVSLSKIANISNAGLNTSENIGRFIDNGNDAWDALIIDYGEAIDLSSNNILKFKFYSTASVKVLAKIEGGTSAELWSEFSNINVWQQFSFDFSEAIYNGNTKLVLFFNGGVTTGNTEDLYYFDDLEWNSATLSVDRNINTDFSTYPNPVIDNLYIQNGSSSKIDKVTVFDSTGREIKECISIDVIDMSSLPKGIYHIRINSNRYTSVKRIIKK